MEIIDFNPRYFSKVISFCDEWIGKDYFSKDDLSLIYESSIVGGLNCSFLAVEDGEIAGVRLCHAPNQFPKNLLTKCTPKKWKVSLGEAGYFKSLFISKRFQGKGIGSKLSRLSLQKFEEMGAKAVVCHSWLESPGNSSQKYLLKFGMEPVADHPNYWADVDYLCSGCQKKPCICTAREMIYYF